MNTYSTHIHHKYIRPTLLSVSWAGSVAPPGPPPTRSHPAGPSYPPISIMGRFSRSTRPSTETLPPSRAFLPNTVWCIHRLTCDRCASSYNTGSGVDGSVCCILLISVAADTGRPDAWIEAL